MRRRTLFIFSGIAAVAVAIAAGVVLLQDPDRYRDELSALLSEALGHEVSLLGPVTLSWRPSPTLSASSIGVAAPQAGVVIDSARVRLEPAALLARRFRAKEVWLEGVTIDISPDRPSETVAVIPDPATLPVDHFVMERVVVRREESTLFRIDRIEMQDPGSARGARVKLRVPVAGGVVEGKVRLRVAGNRVEVDEVDVNTPIGPVEGRLTVVQGAPRPRVEGDLSANAIVVALGAAPGSPSVFPRRDIDLALLSAVDASLRVRVGRLTLGGTRLHDVILPFTLDSGRLSTDATATLADGVTNAAFVLDAPERAWSLSLDVKQADAGAALGMFGVTEAEKGGRMDLHAELRAVGARTGELLESLSGQVNVDASQFHLRSGVAKLAGSDVLSSMARMLRGSDDSRITVECAVARVSVRGGVGSASEGIGAQTRTMNVLGGGRVSLPDERIDLAFRPWPREGIGVSAGAVVGSVAISGSLSEPRVGLAGDAALQGGATAGAALMTGGLSLIVQGLLERARGDTPCQQAAGSSSVRDAGRSGTSKTIDTATDRVGGAIKDLGKTIEGLFSGSGTRAAPARGGSEQ